MKVWVTRDSAESIMYGGLERLQVWFKKPDYLIRVMSEKDRDTPFGFIGEDQGYYSKFGWYANNKFRVSELSVGNWLGYAEEDNEHKELVVFIWEELVKHFKGKEFNLWPELERSGEAKQSDFLLELDISIKLTR